MKPLANGSRAVGRFVGRFLFLVLLAVPCLGWSQAAADTVVLAAPGDGKSFEWPVITNDGKGLYSRIYEAVFRSAGLKLVQLSLPNQRCKLMVKEGLADFYPGDVPGEAFEGYRFFTPRFAIWYTKGEALLFKKKTIPRWEGAASLKGKQLLSQKGNSHLKALDKYGADLSKEVSGAIDAGTAEGALRMLMAGRADVLVTSIELIETAAQTVGVNLAAEGYQIESLDRAKYYPQFQDNPRGRKLAQIFDDGMVRLSRSGQLATWYQDPSGFASTENIDPALPRP